MMSLTKISVYYCYVLCALCSSLFITCQKDTFNAINAERLAPTITLSTESNEAEAYEGQTVNATVSMEAQAGISSLVVAVDGQTVESIDGVSGQVARVYSIRHLVPEGATVGSRIVYSFALKDRLGRTIEENFTIRVIAPPPIPDFEFEDITVGGRPYKLINLDINMNVTLSNEHDYLLRGKISIIQGATVTIEEGTDIYAEPGAALTVSTGTKLVAEGTAQAHVRFTSLAERSSSAAQGDWLGIFMHGLAPVDRTNPIVVGTDNGVGREYGGTDVDDNSGSLRYVEISYAGGPLRGSGGSNDQEINAALNLNGVGKNTRLEYIFVNEAGLSRTAVLAAGGAARIKYLFVNNPNGRAFVWKDGYAGLVQFLAVNYTSNPTNAFTAVDGFDDTSAPIFSNVSIQGGGQSQTRGIRFRSPSKGKVYNCWINGTGNPGLRTDATTDVIFAHGRVWGNATNFHSSASMYNTAAAPYFNSTAAITLTDGHKGISADGALNPTTLDAWFTNATYIGAIDPANDWTAGWISIP